MFSLLFSFLAILLLSAPSGAASPTYDSFHTSGASPAIKMGPETRSSSSTPDAVEQIIEASRTSSPELHARALLLVAESNLVTERERKLKLISEAFEAASSATAPVKKVYGLGVLRNDRSDAGWSNYAFTLNLDRLSLEAKAIEDAYSLSPAAAKELAQDWRLPEMPSVGCTEALVYDPSAYYRVLAVLARNKTANRKDGKDTTEDLLYPAVNHLQTHTQIPLVLELLTKSDLSIKQEQFLTQTFLGQLTKLRDDERGFAAEMTDGSVITRLNQLYQTLEKQEPGSGLALVRNFRQYLMENMRAGGCGVGWLRKQDKQKGKVLPGVVHSFNEQFQNVLVGAGLDPIRVNDIDSQGPVTQPVLHPYFEDPDSERFLEEARQLRFDNGGTRRNIEDLNSSTWSTQVSTYLSEIDD